MKVTADFRNVTAGLSKPSTIHTTNGNKNGLCFQ